MLLHVRHETVYEYDRPVPYSIQTLRLTPRAHDGLRVETWRVSSDRRRHVPRYTDGFGNVTHVHAVREPHTRIAIVAEGVVETRDTTGIMRGAPEPLPPEFYLRPTPLTIPSPGIEALAAEAARTPATLERLHRLLGLVHDRLAYRRGATHVGTTAAAALAQGSGVCQDHAHVFVAAARSLGIPARYVGGYLWGDDAPDPDGAGHAWTEAHHPDLGWIAFDSAGGACPGERHVPCSVGLDYLDAAPVRGVRPALGAEDLTVRVAVAEVQQQ